MVKIRQKSGVWAVLNCQYSILWFFVNFSRTSCSGSFSYKKIVIYSWRHLAAILGTPDRRKRRIAGINSLFASQTKIMSRVLDKLNAA
jgi:hypothetical protein